MSKSSWNRIKEGWGVACCEGQAFEERRRRLRAVLEGRGVDALLVIGGENRRYLSGFTGSAGWLLVTAAKCFLFTDFRYLEQSAQEAPGVEIVDNGRERDMPGRLAERVAAEGVKRLGFESHVLTHRQFGVLSAALPEALHALDDTVEGLRQVKDAGEVAAMRRAAEIGDQAWRHLRGVLKAGASEREVAIELEFFMRKNGAEAASFEPIIASGPRGALPHADPTSRRLVPGDLVVCDFGCRVDGYNSDMTRTVVIGEPTEEQSRMYEAVRRAQAAALALIRPGATCGAVDAAARESLAAEGLAERFGHGLGHGVGLAVHEGPSLKAGEASALEPGMVSTVEPGVYVPGWGGIRLEDMALVTETGYELLTSSPRELLVI